MNEESASKHAITTSLLITFAALVLSSASAFEADSFGPRVDFAASSGQVNVALGDLDGDGKLDIVMVNFFVTLLDDPQ